MADPETKVDIPSAERAPDSSATANTILSKPDGHEVVLSAYATKIKEYREHFERLGVGTVRADFDARRYKDAGKRATAVVWLAEQEDKQKALDVQRHREVVRWAIVGFIVAVLAIVVTIWVGKG